MYEKCKNITVPTTASAQVKNLQVGFVSTTFSNIKVLLPSDEFVDNFRLSVLMLSGGRCMLAMSGRMYSQVWTMMFF